MTKFLENELDTDGPVPHPLYGDHGDELGAAIDEAGVDIIADGDQVVADADFCHLLQILFGVNSAGGVVGRVEQDGPGLGRDQAFQPLGVQGETLLPAGGQRHRHAACHADLVRIDHEIRVRHDDLVPRIDDGQQRFCHADAAGRRDKDFLQGNVQPIGPLVVAADLLPQGGVALSGCVFGVALPGIFKSGLQDLARRGQVRVADGQIDQIGILAGAFCKIGAAGRQDAALGDAHGLLHGFCSLRVPTKLGIGNQSLIVFHCITTPGG